MANINKIKVGSVDPDAIMFDKIHENMSNLKFDFTKWTKNKAFPNDITVEQGRITIRKFKPNTWIIKSPDVKGSQNSAICTYCRGTIMHARGISNYSNIFSKDQEMRNVAGAGNDLPKFRGFCPYPMQTDGTYTNWMQVAAYTWEATWDKDDNLKGSGTGPTLADWNAFRLGGGGYGSYGIWEDFNTKTMFPDTLYDFNTWGRNPDNNVTWNYGFMLATGNVNDFDDTSWSTANGAILDGKKVKVTNRLETTSTGWHVGKNCAPKACKIKVTGLSEGDSVHYGANNPATRDVELCTSDGTYDISAQSNGGSQGFGFRVCGTGTSEVTLEFVNELTDENGLIDVSSDPIVIELFNTNGVDVTSVECWDAFVGETKVWHKDKTFENCWKKYGLAFPDNWKLLKTDFSTSNYITWVSPTKFRVNSIPSEGITIRTTTTTNANYIKLNWKQFTIKLSDGVPEGTIVKAIREFSNAYDTYDEDSHTWSNPTQNIEAVLEVGDNVIPAVTKEIHKKDTDPSMTYNECAIVITPGLVKGATEFYVELVPAFGASDILTVTGDKWDLGPVYMQPIIDIESYIDRMNFSVNPTNADFWNPIKEYYKNHTFNNDSSRKFNWARNIEELELTLPDYSFLYYDYAFKHSEITKLTLKGQSNTQISSLNGIFEGCSKLKTLEIEIDPGNTNDCIAGANDCSNMFNGCALETYPAKFINWADNHGNAQWYSVPATHLQSAFWQSSIKNIPAYPTENPEDPRNVMYAGTADGLFNNARELETVGPILNLELIIPNKADKIFTECNKLNYIRIKGLNHGDWHFDNTEFESRKKHGTLAALGTESIQYLFNNLKDLNTYDPDKSKSTPSNSFAEWSSNYFNSGVYQSAYDFKFNGMDELVGHLRTATQASAPFIVHTNKTGINMSINVSGLAEGDSLVFTAAGDAEPDLTITKDGPYTVTKNDTIDKGFKLIGDHSKETDITITIDKGWDLRIPTVNHANLYCPQEWSDKVTSEMVIAANTKGWTIYIGGTLKTV